jgi:hypothetical protein
MSKKRNEFTGMFDVLEALENVLRSAELSERREFTRVLKRYAKDCPDEFFWAISAQSPTLLHNMMAAIDLGCQPDARPKARLQIDLSECAHVGTA